MTRFFLLFLPMLAPNSPLFASPVSIGRKPPVVTLANDEGGLVKGGGPWSSTEIKDRIWIMFYVDPDESTLNDHVSAALKIEDFPSEKFGSVAIINMDASWKPNFAINSVLKSKQEEFPRTIYVKDMKKMLVKEWGLADDNNDVIAFDRDGTVLFIENGKLSQTRLDELIALLRKKV